MNDLTGVLGAGSRSGDGAGEPALQTVGSALPACPGPPPRHHGNAASHDGVGPEEGQAGPEVTGAMSEVTL